MVNESLKPEGTWHLGDIHAALIERYPSLLVDLGAERGEMTTARFRVAGSPRVQVDVAVDVDGSVSVVAEAQNLRTEEVATLRGSSAQQTSLWKQLVLLGDGGLEAVRTISWLGRFSPVWVGPPGSAQVIDAKSRRYSEVVARVDGWN